MHYALYGYGPPPQTSQLRLTIIDTIIHHILHIHTNDAYTHDTDLTPDSATPSHNNRHNTQLYTIYTIYCIYILIYTNNAYIYDTDLCVYLCAAASASFSVAAIRLGGGR
jgi:hypothetical protein